MSETVRVELGARGYDVLVGHGVVGELARVVRETTGARRAAVHTPAGLPLAAAPRGPATRIELPAGEAAKDLAVVARVAGELARAGITRDDAIVGVGGGVVTDVAGFVAATWHRGTPVVHVATTLVGMVDAAIGGKTGVNLPEGKNLVGAFWQPRAVLCELDALAHLPARETRCGLGEIAKYHFLTGEDLLALPMARRVARCVAIKAAVVAEDETESGRRAILNYGHTLAHALERTTGHALAHGETVAIGLVFAAEVAGAMGRIDAARVRRHYEVVRDAYGLPVEVPRGAGRDELAAYMRRDKKAREGYAFVLDGPSGVELVRDVPPDAVDRAFDALGVG
ncbi:MAG: 3-dehydroquinate synthase family protein [Ilumatobacteraceae bacterium]